MVQRVGMAGRRQRSPSRQFAGYSIHEVLLCMTTLSRALIWCTEFGNKYTARSTKTPWRAEASQLPARARWWRRCFELCQPHMQCSRQQRTRWQGQPTLRPERMYQQMLARKTVCRAVEHTASGRQAMPAHLLEFLTTCLEHTTAPHYPAQRPNVPISLQGYRRPSAAAAPDAARHHLLPSISGSNMLLQC